MDIKESKQFQEKLDEILKDTESFVNASKELKNTKIALDQYIKEAEMLNESLRIISQKAGECAENTLLLMNGDFKGEIQSAAGEALAAMEICVEQSKRLQKEYEETLNLGNYKKLSEKIAGIMKSVDEIKTIIENTYNYAEENSEKLDRVLSLLEALV